MTEKINDKYVYIDVSSLSSEICDTIINKFNNDNPNKRKLRISGITDSNE